MPLILLMLAAALIPKTDEQFSACLEIISTGFYQALKIIPVRKIKDTVSCEQGDNPVEKHE